MKLELSFYRHLEITALLVEVTKDLIINGLLVELILGYSRGFNSRPLLTDHDRMSRGLYQVWVGLV